MYITILNDDCRKTLNDEDGNPELLKGMKKYGEGQITITLYVTSHVRREEKRLILS